MSPEGRTLRNVRVERAIRAFERLGYRTARVKGSHHVLTHPERGLLVLPFHRGTVKVGILLDVLKKAGIPVQEFQDLL